MKKYTCILYREFYHEGIKKILFNVGIINCFDDIYIYIYKCSSLFKHMSFQFRSL